MFKLESYLSPIILSYVNKYIKNFRPQNSQLSLWGGDVSFHNLDLRLEVLEQELHLPFSFVSGHIHELLIHCPWTKLASEPITITINTIECILKLRGSDGPLVVPERLKKNTSKRDHADSPPPSYAQLLINKIVSNIRIYCNNLILKYVEEDIVLSMNVKHSTIESANEKWEPEYTDMHLLMRKVIAINDLTICLDRRNASGKIDVYQEPMLYKCSLIIHFLKTNVGNANKTAATSRCDIYCNSMEFNMTEQQVPMLMRLLCLLQALHQKELKTGWEIDGNENADDDLSDCGIEKQSLAGWAWSFVPSLLPAGYDVDVQHMHTLGPTTHIGFYIDNASIIFKVSETSKDKSTYYAQRKLNYWPLLSLRLQGIFSDTIIHGKKWCQVNMGVSEMILLPEGQCSCSLQDIDDTHPAIEFLKAGQRSELHKTDSLFDAEAQENKGEQKMYAANWDAHLERNSEAVLLERSPAICLDYIYELLPCEDEMMAENLSELGSDLEYSNIPERTLLRLVFGPLKFRLCSSFLHRFGSLQAAAAAYDYRPYSQCKPELELSELPPPSEDDYDALIANIPMKVVQIIVLAPVCEVWLMDHPHFEAEAGVLFKKRRKMSQSQVLDVPKLTFECQCIDVKITYPMYIRRLLQTTCLLPSPPATMMAACYSQMTAKMFSFCARLVVSHRSTIILTSTNLSCASKSIYLPQYWIDANVAHSQVLFESDAFSLTGTHPKLTLCYLILEKLLKRDPGLALDFLSKTSIIQDAVNNNALPFMEVCIEGIIYKKMRTQSTICMHMSLASAKAFIIEPMDVEANEAFNMSSTLPSSHFFSPREIHQVLIISGPEMEETSKLFTATLQFPIQPEEQKHPTLLLFDLKEIKVCVDPLLCKWLIYAPEMSAFSRKVPEVFNDQSLRKLSHSVEKVPYESVHSSIELETILKAQKYVDKETCAEEIDANIVSNDLFKKNPSGFGYYIAIFRDLQDKLHVFFKKWFNSWKSLLINGDISQCTVYFPIKSLSAVGSQGIQETVKDAVNDRDPPDILVVSLPATHIRNSLSKLHLNVHRDAAEMPIGLSNELWSGDKPSFPWNISINNMACYSWQNGIRRDCMAPISLSSTISMSSKSDNLHDNLNPNYKSREHHFPNEKMNAFAICVHIDVAPITISIVESQVCLFANILKRLLEVVDIYQRHPKTPHMKEEAIQTASSSQQGSGISPTMKESFDSQTEKESSHKLDESCVTENSKLAAWIQWTITRFTMQILTGRNDDRAVQPRLKIVVDLEDIVSSLDFQNVYLKLKSKIGSASVKHFVREPNGNWSAGEFLGLVMRVNEENLGEEGQEDTSFASITITQASCVHAHGLWGATKAKTDASKTPIVVKSARNITEIMIAVQPIDLLLSPTILMHYFLALEPLLQIPGGKTKTNAVSPFVISNQTLPLAYVELNGFRLMMPSVEMGKADSLHNICVLQVNKVHLCPRAVNPICRIPYRPDIYQRSARQGLLNIPGSEFEDRQYQIDINGVSLKSSVWSDLRNVLNKKKNVSILKTMSENPALEWNNIENKYNKSKSDESCVIISSFNVSIIFAPAMMLKNDVICGHSIEVNFISDIDVTMSLDQIKLVAKLLEETLEVQNVLLSRKRAGKSFLLHDDTNKDSGIDTSDLKSGSFSTTTNDNLNWRKLSNISKCDALSSTATIPIDILIAGGNINAILYELGSKQFSKSYHESDSEKGYEASEEESTAEENIYHRFIPLVYLSLSQPNVFWSTTNLSMKLQMSCYDICVKISEDKVKPLKSIPCKDNFSTHLLETKSGEPNPETGVLPAFVTLKWSKAMRKAAILNLDIAKPTKVVCSLSRWAHVLSISQKIVTNSSIGFPKTKYHAKQPSKVFSGHEHYIKYAQIKHRFTGISNIVLNAAQVVLAMQTKNNIEVNLSLCNVTNRLNLCSRPERIANIVAVESLSLGVRNGSESKLILNPWCFSCDIMLFWEAWQHSNSNPQIQVSLESDALVLDISPDKILNILDLVEDLQKLHNSILLHSNDTEEHSATPKSLKEPISEKEQHYKDDLRAGAFHFVDSGSNNINELPLPYQVVFWNRTLSAMAWRYPQPRALTKVRIFPVPFKINNGSEDEYQIQCHLEFWSECHGCYQTYTQFYLSETEMCHLELPNNYPQPAVACIWRIVLSSAASPLGHYSKVNINPRALAGCIRIDSYFNKNLIPRLTFALHITSVTLNLINYFDRERKFKYPAALSRFSCDMMIPEYQQFLTLTIDNTNIYLAQWNFEMLVMDMNCNVKCSIIDYAFLTSDMLIEPFHCKCEISLAKVLGVNFVSQPIQLSIGASAAHTIAVSIQQWSAILSRRSDFVILTRYVVCNDTDFLLRFGQSSIEEIALPSRSFHLYAWRSQKSKQMLRVAIEGSSNLMWSEAFSVEKDGMSVFKLSNEHNIFVMVTSLSATQKQIVFHGQLVIYNALVEHFEFKVVKAVSKEKEREFQLTQSHIARGKAMPSGLMLQTNQNYFLRLRFYALDSAWSGDIPMAENTKCSQPWLVKVPLRERGQFLSIWCRNVVQKYPNGEMILTMLWPLFMIRSHLPSSAQMHIETPTLNVHLETTVRGRGECQQLYCPGTIDHSHQLTFQIDNVDTNSIPYVSLNYSLVDQKQFFKHFDKNVNIDEIIKTVTTLDSNEWPFLTAFCDNVTQIPEEQALTHVQVRYQNACLYSSALLVELLPWALFINSVGCPVAILANEKELCRIQHNSVVAPPKLEETFNIAVGLENTWNPSPALQLAKSNWSQAFYMPSITGSIPSDGCIKSVIYCEEYACTLSISSSMHSDMRIIRLATSHVITNHLNMQVYVMCFAIAENRRKARLPPIFDKQTFVIPPKLHKIHAGIPIMQWFYVDNAGDLNANLALYMTFASNPHYGWSCPVRVDKCNLRRSISIPYESQSVPIVIVQQEQKGQSFISIHHDLYPQLFIENFSGTRLYCAQYNMDQSLVVAESEHFQWIACIADTFSHYYSMPSINDKFPDIQTAEQSELLVFTVDQTHETQPILWSSAINTSNLNDQFVRIPYYGDVKVTISETTHGNTIRIESVSRVEISARDIRGRLSLHENDLLACKDTDGSPTMPSSYFTAEETFSQAVSDRSLSSQLNLDIYDESDNVHTVRYGSQLKVSAFIQNLTFTFTSDLENGGAERKEVICIICDNIATSFTKTNISELCLSISDIQIDNQLYTRESFDFPVLLLNQERNVKTPEMSFNVPINQLIEQATQKCSFRLEAHIEHWRDIFRNENEMDIKDVRIRFEGISIFLEDSFLLKLLEYASMLMPSALVTWPEKQESSTVELGFVSVAYPKHLNYGSKMVARPLRLRNFVIDEINISMSIHSSSKLYLAIDASPLHFGKFERKRMFTMYDRLGHAMTMHYISGAIFGAGWALSSLELLGSPGGLARAMGSGLRDFVSYPYHGFIHGPWAFLVGVSYGSASLMKHVTAGTLQSVTKLASSVARNLDRLTLDVEHLRRTEAWRRQRPEGLTQGFVQGLTGFGISLLSAVGGIAHHPLQSMMTESVSAGALVAGVGRGLVGVITKPLSGAAELVALTGQGLLQGAGWNRMPAARKSPVLNQIFSMANSSLKGGWKFMKPTFGKILLVSEGTAVSDCNEYVAVALILTSEGVIVVNVDEDKEHRMFKLSEISGVLNNDPTLLCLKYEPPKVALPPVDDGVPLEMDAVSRARVADYVRSTGIVQLAEDKALFEHSTMFAINAARQNEVKSTMLTYYINPQCRNYFLCLLALAKQEIHNYNFPIL